MTTVSVVVPCYNEEGNVQELVERLGALFERKQIDGEVLLINDCSTDGTGPIIEGLARTYGFVRAFHHETNRGIEAAWRTGIDQARGTYTCLMDADLQNQPEDVYRLLREIQWSGSDMVQGFRSSIGRLKDARYTLSKGLNFLLNRLFGMRLRDNKSGFVIARREVLADVISHRFRYRYFQTFITVAAKSKGYTIREIETLFESRLVGRSFMSRFPVGVILWCLVDLAKGAWEYRLFPRRENVLADFLATHPATKTDPDLPFIRRTWFKVFCLTMPVHKWMITRQAERYYRDLKRSQYLSPGDLRELQNLKLRKLILHAYHHVSYYRELLDREGIDPTSIRTVEDLARVPLLSKDAVRANLHFDLMSDNHDKRKILKINTSGSTGEPFVFYADRHQLEIRWASTQRSLEWTGYRFGDRTARLWHQTIGMSRSQVVRERLDAWFNRRLFIPAFEMTDRNIERFALKLQQHRPVLIDGYAESFNFLAHYLKSARLAIRPRAVVSSAQVLPDQSRRVIEHSFGCGVFDKYGSREFSGIAYECGEHDGMHVVAESYIVEILKSGRPARPGELGEVVITDLNNYCVPLIRYRIGDLAMAMDNAGVCGCGRGLPKIGRIEGRVQAIIFGTNGAYIPGTFFAHLFKDYEHVVRQYQVVQSERGSITLRVIKALRYTDQAFDEILDRLREYVGRDMRIDVRFTDRIEMVRTGKHQGSISRLEFDFQQPEFSGGDAGPLTDVPLGTGAEPHASPGPKEV
jgi:phenylacetate-CoA ligase